MPVTSEEMIEAALHPIQRALNSHGITFDRLAQLTKRHLNAKSVDHIRVKGKVDPQSLPRGYKLIAVTEEYSLIRYVGPDYSVRESARKDALKLHGAYPAEKHEVSDPATQWLAETIAEIHRENQGLPPLPSQRVDED